MPPEFVSNAAEGCLRRRWKAPLTWRTIPCTACRWSVQQSPAEVLAYVAHHPQIIQLGVMAAMMASMLGTGVSVHWLAHG